MSKLVLFGATGYAGAAIRDEALRRGHEVVAVARGVASLSPAERLRPRAGTVHDEVFVNEVSEGADVLAVAIPARPIDGRKLADAVPVLNRVARDRRIRLGFVGGAGSLLVAEDGPRLLDTPEFPEFALPEAGNHALVLDSLRVLDEPADWFYVSPAPNFGAHAPGDSRGHYRIGGEVLLPDAAELSSADLALAFVDEIDRPAHHGARFAVA